MRASSEFRTVPGWDVAVVAAILAAVLLGWVTAAGGNDARAPRPAPRRPCLPAGRGNTRRPGQVHPAMISYEAMRIPRMRGRAVSSPLSQAVPAASRRGSAGPPPAPGGSRAGSLPACSA